ncbi:hypothetical protein GGR56DRAFT_387745 [Xylariaceae sp. FL0804]|nr:hypothetical protein GGR56DRAFT_387745 [Xylariaceae sp. FL0804]
MKFAGSTLFAAAASAAAIRSANQTWSYTVSNFTAGCIPHSTECSYEFDVMVSDFGAGASGHCSKTMGSDGSLPGFDVPQECTNLQYTFAVYASPEGNAGGLDLEVDTPNVATNDGGVVQGLYSIPAAELEYTSTGAGEVQTYTGPESFTFSASLAYD